MFGTFVFSVYGTMDNQKQVKYDFCDGYCYDDNPISELNCNKVKCCYLVHEECILINGDGI